MPTLDILARREAPEKREARREKRAAERVSRGTGDAGTGREAGQQDRGEEVSNHARPARASTRTRHVSAAIRDRVHVRDQGRCSYVGSTGQRCNAVAGLQLDHVRPFARGGEGTAGNLRLLCAAHNRLEAERVMGTGSPAG